MEKSGQPDWRPAREAFRRERSRIWCASATFVAWWYAWGWDGRAHANRRTVYKL